MIDFTDNAYLKDGSVKQQEVFKLLINSNIMELLVAFNPVLAGTIPLNIDIEESDLDVICYWKNKEEFVSVVFTHFAGKQSFRIRESIINGEITVIANFFIEDFEIEIFGQNIPVMQQNAFRHMVVEYHLLMERGEDFRNAIIELKQQGLKTEPAFAKLLGLSGDPYVSLLAYENG